MNSDWWACKETRRKINAKHDKHAAEQIAEINRAYKEAKIPGATPKHWLGKINRMNKLGRPMPKGLEHLAGSFVDDLTLQFIESGKKAAQKYFASEYASIRSQTLKKTQKKYATLSSSRFSQGKGGSNSGAARRLRRNEAASAIVDQYRKATAIAVSVKPVARLVADWYIKNFPSNQSHRAMTQMLQRAGAAT